MCLHECVHMRVDGKSLDKDTEMKHGPLLTQDVKKESEGTI